MTKSDTRDAAGLKADLDRFRRELGTDYIDIVLIHCVTEDDWTTRYPRRNGCAFGGEAERRDPCPRKVPCRQHRRPRRRRRLGLGSPSTWARLNPVQAFELDATPDTVTGVIKQMRASGKGIVGMKILGQGAMRNRPSEALQYALGSGVLDAFTIGAENQTEQNDLVHRIAAAA